MLVRCKQIGKNGEYAAVLAKLAAGRGDFMAGEKLEPIYLQEVNFIKVPPCKPGVMVLAFTLMEVVMSITILAMVLSGVIYGYVEANKIAEWNSMSLAAQSIALQGMEQSRAAQWNSQAWPTPTNSEPDDQLYVSNSIGAFWTTNLSGTNYAMDVPATGAPFYCTNTITITTVQVTPPLRMIRSDCIWTFPATKITYTNTAITYRAPDQ